jgi:hypothetical protein
MCIGTISTLDDDPSPRLSKFAVHVLYNRNWESSYKRHSITPKLFLVAGVSPGVSCSSFKTPMMELGWLKEEESRKKIQIQCQQLGLSFPFLLLVLTSFTSVYWAWDRNNLP